VLARAVGALDGGMEQRTRLLDIAAVEHRAQRRLHAGQRNVGQKSQPTLVDADQRNIVRGELARIRQHRAVAADDDGEIDCLTELLGRHRPDAGQRCKARGVLLMHHRVSARGEKGGESR
jgi:hypothetical protein